MELLNSNFNLEGGTASYSINDEIITAVISDVVPQWEKDETGYFFNGVKSKITLKFSDADTVNDFLKKHKKISKNDLVNIEKDAMFGYNEYAKTNFSAPV